MKLEGIVISERSQTKKDHHCMVSLRGEIAYKKSELTGARSAAAVLGSEGGGGERSWSERTDFWLSGGQMLRIVPRTVW